MQEAINQELHIYLTEILELLCNEKSSTTNVIDSLIDNLGLNNHYNKQCLNYKE